MNASETVRGQATLDISVELQATGRVRANMALPHLLAAGVHCRRVGMLEATHAGKDFGEFWNEIFANASATVFASVASMEAYANELFIDHRTVFPDLRTEVMAKLWELYEQKPPLEKFEFALLLKDKSAFDRGASPFQDVAAIIRLRNGLIHFKPEWFSQQDEHAKLSALLEYRATPSSFFPAPEPLFPRGWASHATAKWIVQSVLAFLVEFELMAGIAPRVGKFKDRFDAL